MPTTTTRRRHAAAARAARVVADITLVDALQTLGAFARATEPSARVRRTRVTTAASAAPVDEARAKVIASRRNHVRRIETCLAKNHELHNRHEPLTPKRRAALETFLVRSRERLAEAEAGVVVKRSGMLNGGRAVDDAPRTRWYSTAVAMAPACTCGKPLAYRATNQDTHETVDGCTRHALDTVDGWRASGEAATLDYLPGDARIATADTEGARVARAALGVAPTTTSAPDSARAA